MDMSPYVFDILSLVMWWVGVHPTPRDLVADHRHHLGRHARKWSIAALKKFTGPALASGLHMNFHIQCLDLGYPMNHQW